MLRGSVRESGGQGNSQMSHRSCSNTIAKSFDPSGENRNRARVHARVLADGDPGHLRGGAPGGEEIQIDIGSRPSSNLAKTRAFPSGDAASPSKNRLPPRAPNRRSGAPPAVEIDQTSRGACSNPRK